MEAFYLVLLAFLAASRLTELVYSRSNRARMKEGGASAGKDPIFPWMVFTHAMPFWIIPLEILALDRVFIPALGWPMLVVFGLAQLMRVWVFVSLRRYWNAQIMVPPDLEPVTVGPYQYIRHPNYAVVIVELLTFPLIHTAWISAIALTVANAIALYYRISWEESQLFQIPAYVQKMGHKKRFIPGVF